MNLLDLKKIIRPLLDTGISLELIGPPGVGKSDFVEQAKNAQSKKDNEEWGFAKLFLATQTPPDLLGYQFKGEREIRGKMTTVTDPSMPLWCQTTNGDTVFNYRRGVLFLDEYGQGELDVKRASAELLLNKRLGPWQLPPGWSVLAASNRQSDRSGVTKALDFVINRRTELPIEADELSWVDWATANGIDPFFIAFARAHSNIVFSNKVPEVQRPWCTSRSLVSAEKHLKEMAKYMSKDDDQVNTDYVRLPTDKLAQSVVAGTIGASESAQLFTYIKVAYDLPTYAEVMADPANCRLPERPDGRMLIMYSLAGKADEKNVAKGLTYMKRMQTEFATSYVQALCRRDPLLIFQDDVAQYIESNSNLISLMSAA